MCRKEDETQNHILEECTVMHPNDDIKVPTSKLFDENTVTLRNVVRNLEKITEKLGLGASHFREKVNKMILSNKKMLVVTDIYPFEFARILVFMLFGSKANRKTGCQQYLRISK